MKGPWNLAIHVSQIRDNITTPGIPLFSDWKTQKPTNVGHFPFNDINLDNCALLFWLNLLYYSYCLLWDMNAERTYSQKNNLKLEFYYLPFARGFPQMQCSVQKLHFIQWQYFVLLKLKITCF